MVLPFRPQPVCEFRGHEDDVFDLSWGSDLFLLSASRDRTVRLWHVFTDGALKIFRCATLSSSRVATRMLGTLGIVLAAYI
jgi:WD40 repeat protein